jgi:hypothetical protein
LAFDKKPTVKEVLNHGTKVFYSRGCEEGVDQLATADRFGVAGSSATIILL